MTEEEKPNDITDSQKLNLEKILEEKARLEALLEDEFTRFITVMFTDMKGSTALTESKGDMAVRLLIKKHNEIVFPAFKNNNGTLVKTMGDGTMSYFKNAQDALKAGIEIQTRIREYNNSGKLSTPPLQLRVGIHSGTGIVEDDDIYGDVVNVASRFEQIATVGDVYFSEETYKNLENKEEIYVRAIKSTYLKGKKEPVMVYKAFYDEKEIEADKANPTFEEAKADGAVKATLAVTGKEPDLKILIPGESPRDYKITADEITIGRSSHNHVALEKPFVSRKHCRIYLDGGKYIIQDLQSSLGVSVNGGKVQKKELKNGDTIEIGDISIKFIEAAAAAVNLEEEDSQATMAMQAYTDDEDSGATMAISAVANSKLVVFHDKDRVTEHPITAEGLILGRLNTSDVVIEDGLASRRHAKVWAEGEKIFVEDLGSQNGTVIGSARLEKNVKTEVKQGDEIIICSYKIGIADISVRTDEESAKAQTDSGTFKLFNMFGKKK